MTEKRVIIGHVGHDVPGPHLDPPAGFGPLRLQLASENAVIEVTCLAAIVGRHTDADLRFAYPDISRRHCRFVFENCQWRIHDLKSLNGIYVNNARVREATLYAGDALRIGCVQLLVLTGTPIRVTKAAEKQNEKLRQIADAFPAED